MEIYANELNVGDIVEIDDVLYIVNKLIGCVEWQWSQGEYYLHSLTGEGFFHYPLKLNHLRALVAERKGRVFSKKEYKLQVVQK